MRETFRLNHLGEWEKVPFYSLYVDDMVKFIDDGKRVATKDGKKCFRVLTLPKYLTTLKNGFENYICETLPL